MTDAPLAPELRRLLKRLAAPRTWLEPCVARGHEAPIGQLTLVRDGEHTSEILTGDHVALVTVAREKGWLVACGHRLALAPEGRAILRRTLAGGIAPDSDRATKPAVMRRSERPPAARYRHRPADNAPGLNEAESPLGWLRRRKDRDGQPLIDEEQFSAGERLRADIFFSGVTPRVTAHWSPVAGGASQRRGAPGGSAQMLDQMVAARQRVSRAMTAVGPELSGILMDVCGFMKGLEVIEAERGWPARTGKVVLLLALSRLAAHYGLAKSATAAASSSPVKIRHWGMDDFRPDLAAWTGDGPVSDLETKAVGVVAGHPTRH